MIKGIGARIWKDIKDLWVVAAALIIYSVFMNLVFHAFCPMVIVTGFPCPGCGMTRALFYLMTGRIGESVRMNPMGIPIACLVVYYCFNRYFLGRKAKGMKFLIGMAMVLLLLGFGLRMYLYFPDREPYVYTERNILAGTFPFYEQILHELQIL